MDINQLTSFVDYQLGQKQGWEALSEVLHRLQTADDEVAKAKATVDGFAKEVSDMQATLIQMDETAKVKSVELQEKLQVIRDADLATRTTQVADLDKQIADKQALYSELLLQEATILSAIETAKGDQILLDKANFEAQSHLDDTISKLAVIKGSI